MTAFQDFFIRANDRNHADSLLLAAGLLVHHAGDPDTGELGSLTPADRASLYYVGIISEGGEWDEEGNETKPPEIAEGYHVNLRVRGELSGEELEILRPVLVVPNSPVAVFG